MGERVIELAAILDAELRRRSFRFSRETELQELLATLLAELGIDYSREFRAQLGRYDFLCGEVVIEVKVRGSYAEALAQADRYCQSEQVSGVIILSSAPWSQSRESEHRGKPVRCVRIWRASF